MTLDVNPWADEAPPQSLSITAKSEEGIGYDYTGFLIFIKALGLCSMFASTFLLRDILIKLHSSGQNWGQKISLTQSILFCLSLGDFFSAFFVQFMSTWMVPKTVQVSFASGTVASCTMQGMFGYFFYSLSTSSNASLAVAYCLIVKIGWNDHDKDWRRNFFTIIPAIFALTLATIPLQGKNYNYNGAFFCDITASPLGCDYPDSTTQCTRGADSRKLLLYVGVIPFMVAFAIIIAAMSVLVYSVLKQERRMDRYRQNGQGVDRSMTQQVGRQGLYYIAAFGVCWIPWYIYAIIEYKQGEIPQLVGFIHLTTLPLQGVFNAMVYFRPKYKARRASNPGESSIGSTLKVLKVSLPTIKCAFCHKREKGSGETSNKTNGAEENANNEVKNEEEGDWSNVGKTNNVTVSCDVVNGDKRKSSVHFSEAD